MYINVDVDVDEVLKELDDAELIACLSSRSNGGEGVDSVWQNLSMHDRSDLIARIIHDDPGVLEYGPARKELRLWGWTTTKKDRNIA